MKAAAEVKRLLEKITEDYNIVSSKHKRLFNDCTKLQEEINTQLTRNEALSKAIMELQKDISPPPPEEEPQVQDWSVEPFSEANPPPFTLSLFAEILETSVVSSCRFSQDSSLIAVGSDRTIRVYDIQRDTFVLEHTLTGENPNHFRAICWSKDSKRVYSGTEDHKVYVFDLGTGQISSFDASNGDVFSIECDDENLYVASGSGEVTIWAIADYSNKGELMKAGSEGATSISLLPGSKHIAVGYVDSWVSIWDIEKQEPTLELKVHENSVYCLKVFDNGQKLATGSLDGTIKLWELSSDLSSLHLWKELKGHGSFVLSMAVSSDSRYLMTGSKDLSAIITDLNSGEMLCVIKSHTNSVMAVDFSADGKMLSTGGGDMYLKLWSMS